MNEDQIELTLEEMVGANLRVFDTDPIMCQQFPKFFYYYKKHPNSTPKPKPSIPKEAKRFLNTRQVPRDLQIEANFHPYFKANYQTKKLSKPSTPLKDFDLADEQLKVFNDEHFSLNIISKSTSPVRVSRLPASTSVKRSLAGREKIKTRSNSLSKHLERPHTSHRAQYIYSTRNRFLCTRSSPLNTYKAFKLIL
jgi:hypothetical protein